MYSMAFFFFFNLSEGGYCGVFTGIRETRLRTPLPLQNELKSKARGGIAVECCVNKPASGVSF